MSWDFKTLDELGKVARGKSKHRPRNDKRLFGGIYPFIQTADVKKANFYIYEYSETYNEIGLAQSKLWDAGTLCITIAANIADTGILSMPACFPDSIMGFIPYDGISDVRFIKYCFDILQRKCKQISQGTAQDNLSWEKLSTIKFPAPPLKIQCRIAEVLSRYDSLIENYQKQIKLLEEAAQRLYKEWFVDLRFPGYENTKIVDGLPEGWEKNNITELADIQYGYAFDGKLFNSDKVGIPIARIRNIPDGYTNDYTTEEASNDYIVKNGDILVGMDGIFHINTWSGSDAYLVQRTCLFRPKNEILKGFIFQAIKGPIKVFEQTLVGATVAHLGKKHIDSIKLIMPKDFHLYRPLNDLFFYRQKLLNQVRFLVEARDRMLYKLMSGEIKVY
jgi:type I restriction enzyme S subunit